MKAQREFRRLGTIIGLRIRITWGEVCRGEAVRGFSWGHFTSDPEWPACGVAVPRARGLWRSPGRTGGGKGIRTPDLLIANETLYQLSYTPPETGDVVSRTERG